MISLRAPQGLLNNLKDLTDCWVDNEWNGKITKKDLKANDPQAD